MNNTAIAMGAWPNLNINACTSMKLFLFYASRALVNLL